MSIPKLTALRKKRKKRTIKPAYESGLSMLSQV
jgi:hypothetical protein